ncbi:hypothetical protein C8R47DRAFT_1325133 [Mycena vitilis]|nr:hypothetical protein C8R47DRAFT_1325133 [Mycena vitilis]
MDKYYPTQQAATKLEEIAVASKERIRLRAQDNIQHLAKPELNNVFVTDTGRQHKTWRLCTMQDDDDAVDEVIFRVQGVVSKNELVPKHINSLFNVHQKFAQHIAGVPFGNLVTKDAPDGPFLAANNRLFSSRSEVPTEQDNTFQDGVDAIGRLAKLKGAELIHAPENIVKYFRLINGTEGSHYAKEIPGAFKVGDLVEMQLSFVAMMSHKKVKVTNRLQALTLLDNTFSNSASDTRLSAIAVNPVVCIGIRRKVGYFQEDDEDGRVFKKKNSGAL